MAKKTIYAVPVCSLIFSLAFREVLCDSERDYYNKFFDSKKRKPANYSAIMATMDDVHFTIQGVVRNNAAFDVIGDMVAKQSGRYSTAHVFGNECIHLGNAIRSNRKKENHSRSCDLFLSYDENPMCIPGVTFTEKRAKNISRHAL